MSLSSSASLCLYTVCALEGCKQQAASRKGTLPTSGFVHTEPRTFVVYRCLGISHILHSQLTFLCKLFCCFCIAQSCRATWATINRPVSCRPRPRHTALPNALSTHESSLKCLAVCATFGRRPRVVGQGLTERCCTLAFQLLLRATVQPT